MHNIEQRPPPYAWKFNAEAEAEAEPTSRHATRSAERTRTQCGAQRKHVNMIRSHGHECHFAEVQSGDIIRWRHLSPCQSTNRSRPPGIQRAVVGSRCINVRHAAGHSPDAITPTEIVYCSYIQIIKTIHFVTSNIRSG